MFDRFLVWLSAGILTAGVCAATLAGAALAAAQDGDAGAASDAKSTTSQPSNPASAEANSNDTNPGPGTTPDTGAADKSDVEPDRESTETKQDVEVEEGATDGEIADDVTEVAGGEEEVVGEEEGGDNDLPASVESALERGDDTTDTESEDQPRGAPIGNKNDVDLSVGTSSEPVETAVGEDVVVERAAATGESFEIKSEPAAAEVQVVDGVPLGTLSSPSTAVFAFAAPAEAQAEPVAPTLINIIGTIAWSVFDLFSKIIEGPPSVPAGSSVTVGRSTLEIDCGDGYTAEADWYYPKNGQQPEQFIYFQHGFPARAGFYNLTAAELAERNNAIVVAPSITGNIFACDGCSLAADPMHAAVARLFTDDRAALLASARAAGFEGALPGQFVLAGHSGGGQLAAGATGYFYELAPADQKSRLVGALLLDTSATGGALTRALDKLPSTLPVLHIAAAPAPLNTYGNANAALTAARPGQFNGVQLIGGSHSDAYRSSTLFGLAQFIVALGTGASTPENVEAVQVLAQGWMNDMYAGRVYDPTTRTGIYGVPGSPGQTVVDVLTDSGLARAYVLPGPVPQLSIIDLIIAGLLESLNTVNFVSCAADSTASATTSCSATAGTTVLTSFRSTSHRFEWRGVSESSNPSGLLSVKTPQGHGPIS